MNADNAGDVWIAGGGGQTYIGANRSGAFLKLNDDMWFSDPQNGTIEIKNSNASGWGTMVGYFTNQSSRHSKKEIYLLDESRVQGLYSDTINTKLYRFYYNEDDIETTPEKIGLILEESPDYMCVTPDGKSLYTLSYVAMLHGAIQVLNEKLLAVETDNATLKAQVEQILLRLNMA